MQGNNANNNLQTPKMMPSIFKQCHPISNLTEMKEVIEEPPAWTSKVLPLVPRSSTLVKNCSDDCHTEVDNFCLKTRIDARFAPKTLVCHDYKGGYQADRYLHQSDEEIVGQGYTFYNWSQIDIFVYFSHHLITIPPLCWINSGHKNGVKVLGTLITEFSSGKDICDKQIFKDLETMKNFAKSLAQLTVLFGFDGWLLNIENSIINIEVLKKFVPYFTQLIHKDNPNNIVIWYDSVTINGDLSWQNELNEKNQYFFDSCDGIFINYGWDERSLVKCEKMAKYRNFDVYVGIDVFGRNMYGGGKFHTFKAVEMVARHNLSRAIFAPGWTLESLETTEKFFETFLSRDLAFWRSLWSFLYTHPITTYFTTNFYIGLDESCYNLFSQEVQISKCLYPSNLPLVPEYKAITIPNKCSCIQASLISTKNTCLITKSNLNNDAAYVHNLFVTDIDISGNTVVFFLSKNVDQIDTLSCIDVTLVLSGYNGSVRRVVLLGEQKEILKDDSSLLEVNTSDAIDAFKSIRDRYYNKIVEDKWKLSMYIFNTTSSKILEVGATIKYGNSILLGAFGIEDADGNFLKNM